MAEIDYDWAFDSLEQVPFPDGACHLQQAWVAAWGHLDAIAAVMTVRWWQGRELTAGPPCICDDQPDIWCSRDDHARQAWNTPPGCICRDAHWYPGRPDNPRCPVHRSKHQPCTCYYGLHPVVGAPGPWEQYRPPGIRRPRWLTRCFVIVWSCPHHGDNAAEPVTGEWDITELVLDEDERRGH